MPSARRLPCVQCALVLDCLDATWHTTLGMPFHWFNKNKQSILRSDSGLQVDTHREQRCASKLMLPLPRRVSAEITICGGCASNSRGSVTAGHRTVPLPQPAGQHLKHATTRSSHPPMTLPQGDRLLLQKAAPATASALQWPAQRLSKRAPHQRWPPCAEAL